jgi:hypothetical protein
MRASVRLTSVRIATPLTGSSPIDEWHVELRSATPAPRKEPRAEAADRALAGRGRSTEVTGAHRGRRLLIVHTSCQHRRPGPRQPLSDHRRGSPLPGRQFASCLSWLPVVLRDGEVAGPSRQSARQGAGGVRPEQRAELAAGRRGSLARQGISWDWTHEITQEIGEAAEGRRDVPP